jgi:hypothetical protein
VLAIIPCGARKRDGTHPASSLYTGSYFTAALRWAARNASTTLILSAKHGLLTLDQPTETYDLRLGQEGSVTAKHVRQQAGALGLLDYPAVAVVGGKAYRDLARQVWPHASSPVDGCTSMGNHLQVLSRL